MYMSMKVYTGWGKSRFAVVRMEDNTIINSNHTRINCFTCSQLHTYFCPVLFAANKCMWPLHVSVCALHVCQLVLHTCAPALGVQAHLCAGPSFNSKPEAASVSLWVIPSKRPHLEAASSVNACCGNYERLWERSIGNR